MTVLWLRDKPIRRYAVALLVGILFSTALVASSQGAQGTFFPVGPGWSDVIPRQIVRTFDDHVYIFAGEKQDVESLVAYRTTSPGFPGAGGFEGIAEVETNGAPISVDAAYNGGTIIHVLVNTNAGQLLDYPFDLVTNTFRSPLILVSNTPTIAGYYIGTSGVSAMVDRSGLLHVAYWTSGNHIVHRAYTYNSASNTLVASGDPFQVDTAGRANHPAIAISPFDNSLTVAWVSEATEPPRILARTRSSNGVWGDVQTVSTAPVWTSVNNGISIDQGPSLLIGWDGTRHLTYIEDFDDSGHYGRVHYVENKGSGWVDTELNIYSHAPALAINSANELYIIGHGPVQNGSNHNMYTMKRNTNGSWGAPQLFATPPGHDTFDASPSVKWSLVGFNRADVIEFVFFKGEEEDYFDTTLYYGRLAAPTSLTITPQATATPSSTPLPPSLTAHVTLTPTVTNTPLPPPPTFIFQPTFTPPPMFTPISSPLPTNTPVTSEAPEVTDTPYLLPTATATVTPAPLPPPF
jgi:hypothetical protein